MHLSINIIQLCGVCTNHLFFMHQPYVLEAVRKAEQKILQSAMNHEYAGIAGIVVIVNVVVEVVLVLVLGSSVATNESNDITHY